jgi:flagellar biosynthetic protein FliQ
MNPAFAVAIVREALMTAFWVAAPILILSLVVSILLNLVQIATSLQDMAFSTIPRLAVFLIGFLFMLPWMLARLSTYMASILGDLGRFAH